MQDDEAGGQDALCNAGVGLVTIWHGSAQLQGKGGGGKFMEREAVGLWLLRKQRKEASVDDCMSP